MTTAALCEIDECGVIAAGRCATCRRAFCLSHQAQDGQRMVYEGVSVPHAAKCVTCRSKEVAEAAAPWVAHQNEKRQKQNVVIEQLRALPDPIARFLVLMRAFVHLKAGDSERPDRWYVSEGAGVFADLVDELPRKSQSAPVLSLDNYDHGLVGAWFLKELHHRNIPPTGTYPFGEGSTSRFMHRYRPPKETKPGWKLGKRVIFTDETALSLGVADLKPAADILGLPWINVNW